MNTDRPCPLRPPLLAALLLLAAAGHAGDAPPAQNSKAAETAEVVRRLDAARIEALVRGDFATLQAIIDSDCTYTHGSGFVENGLEYRWRLERGDLRYLAMRYEFPALVRVQGPDTAVVSGRLQLTGQGRSGPPNERIMSVTAVYVRRDERWRLISYQSTPAAAAPPCEILSQRIAIENVCAWPKLALLADGTIAAAVYDQPSHGQKPGDVACWASTDGGITWEFRGRATRHEGNSAWFNHSLGVADNGDLLVVTSGWGYLSDAGGKADTPFVPIVSRSADGGRTWKIIARLPKAKESGKAFIPFGNIERGDDGRLRVAAYAFGRGLPPAP